jgi:hypothetical protein
MRYASKQFARAIVAVAAIPIGLSLHSPPTVAAQEQTSASPAATQSAHASKHSGELGVMLVAEHGEGDRGRVGDHDRGYYGGNRGFGFGLNYGRGYGNPWYSPYPQYATPVYPPAYYPYQYYNYRSQPYYHGGAYPYGYRGGVRIGPNFSVTW